MEYLEENKGKPDYLGYGLLLASALFGICLTLAVTRCHKTAPLQDCMTCHRQVAMTNYFKKAGSKTPQALAEAVLKTKNPRLLAAVAVVETGGNNVRKTGFLKAYDGVYQINPKYHGKVSHDLLEQSLQAELVLTGLVEEKKHIIKGLSAYGGDTGKKQKYARSILAELEGKVP